jgi:hypothetical protein
LILVVAPWSPFWDRNFFAEMLPMLESLLASPYVRGAVSGVGMITTLAGLAELGAAFTVRRSQEDAPREPTVQSDR